MNFTRLSVIILVVLQWILVVVLFGMLPAQIAMHWNIKGIADNFGPKWPWAYLLPTLMTILIALLYALPSFDTKRNVHNSQHEFDLLALVISGFMTYIHILTLLWNMVGAFDFGRAVTPGFGLFFILLGIIFYRSKSELFWSVNTPWTIKSPEVQRRTQSFASKLFVCLGVITVVSSLLPEVSFYVLFVGLFAIIISLTLYSYMIYRQLR